MARELLRGENRPFGASCVDGGVNFALFSEHALRVDLCLFDDSGCHETDRLPLIHDGNDVWHGFVPGLAAGALYGYRVHGPWQPAQGHRFNASKLLLDPYARRFSGECQVKVIDHAHAPGAVAGAPYFDTRDNAAAMPRCVVSGAMPETRSRGVVHHPDALIYELHVRGFTMRMDQVPESERGTFAALSRPRCIEYLKALGIECVELMPVHYLVDEAVLLARGLRNYWGYNPIGFFAPANRYLAGGDPQEFRKLVDRFHDAGIEVLLDVVYNHTAEGDERGPTLSFRGIDNAAYYRLDPHDRQRYLNDTGCGNTLNIAHPRVLQLVMDSLRYWMEAMCVDGFRFDLATVLGRELHGFDPGASFFDVLRQDPLLSRARLIAEPWDVGPGGYRLGQFPPPWSEWNDRYRDTVRRFWRGDEGMLPDLARCLHGSADLFEHNRRTPRASVNYVASHDGFTLQDAVSYEQRHNEANGEQNHDGHQGNFSVNHGVEGQSGDARVREKRRRHRRNLLSTLMLSQGTPMLLAGDEFGRTQRGNNNAYCQDNEISWLDWSLLDDDAEAAFQAFVRRLIALRREHPLLRWPRYIHNTEDGPDATHYLWLNRHGEPMSEHDWRDHSQRVLGKLLIASASGEEGSRAHLLVLFNAGSADVAFRLPVGEVPGSWVELLSTAHAVDDSAPPTWSAGEDYPLEPRSVVVFRL